MNKIDLKSLAKRQWQDYHQNNPGTFFLTENQPWIQNTAEIRYSSLEMQKLEEKYLFEALFEICALESRIF